MSEFTATIITKPRWFRIAPMKTGYGPRERYVIGFDTEASHGKPFLMQFAHPDGRVDLVPCNDKTALPAFLDYLESTSAEATKTRQYIVVGWNLRYEYTQLFRHIPIEAYGDPQPTLHWHDLGECEGHDKDDWDLRLRLLNDKRYCFTIELGKSKRRVKVIDGMAFITGSLDNAAKVIGVPRKFKKPKTLGSAEPAALMNDPEFIAYAEQDARITQQVGQKIIDFHAYYDVPIAISAPQFAAYTFRRKYLDGEIPLCDQDIEDAGLAAYHGGKNGLYLDKPTHFRHAYDYDVNGAYTSAMMQLPDPVRSIWHEVMEYEPGVHALWYVRARTASCRYRAFQTRAGRWLTWQDDGEQEFWITGYELDAAIERDELDILECSGFVLRGNDASGSLNAFCTDMAEQKRHGETAELREMAKLCLNSLYGKTIQKVPVGSDTVYPMFEETDGGKLVDPNMKPGGYRAGGLYHPAIAALITGYVRAVIHRLEHKYEAIMTSTDGFLSLVPPDPTDIGPAIGQLKVKEGNLRVWRERLYYFRVRSGQPCLPECEHDEHEKGCPNSPVYARHGFHGELSDLLHIPLRIGRFPYTARLMVGLRQSLTRINKAYYEPGEFVDIPLILDLTSVNLRAPLPP